MKFDMDAPKTRLRKFALGCLIVVLWLLAYVFFNFDDLIENFRP